MRRNIDILFKIKSYLKTKDQVKRSLGVSLLKINLKIAITAWKNTFERLSTSKVIMED